MVRFAVLKCEGVSIGIVAENVTWIEPVDQRTRVHLVNGKSIDVDVPIQQAVQKLQGN